MSSSSTAPDAVSAIHARRSIKRFTDQPVSREQIEHLLEAAVQAPNHRMTEPWRFYVLGPQARRAFGEVLGGRKARKVEDPEAARLVREKVAHEHEALPAMLAVAMVLDDNPEIREEDYASTMMAIQNLTVVAATVGLGTHIKSGAVMDDPGARAAIGVPEGQRVVATIPLGVPAEIPSPKQRSAATSFTTWRD
ncbi:MAG: nitroreductase [Gemmatimonadota bacterium]|nr:nitroreductase [Gemmatimonadota bacterium]